MKKELNPLNIIKHVYVIKEEIILVILKKYRQLILNLRLKILKNRKNYKKILIFLKFINELL